MAEPYPQTHPAMRVARTIVNQILDRFTEALPAGPIDGFTEARQAINDECDQHVAGRLEAYAARPEPTPEPDLLTEVLWEFYLGSCVCNLDPGSRCSCRANEMAATRLRDLLGEDWHDLCRLRFPKEGTDG